MNLKPLGDRLLVKPIEQDSTTPGGVILPETAKEIPMQGVVLAAGPGKLKDGGGREVMEVRAGSVILYPKYTGIEVKVEGKKRLIIKEGDVLAIVVD